MVENALGVARGKIQPPRKRRPLSGRGLFEVQDVQRYMEADSNPVVCHIYLHAKLRMSMDFGTVS
jgi:hypothetical protein